MITVKIQDQRASPVLQCDHCSERIIHVETGVAVWCEPKVLPVSCQQYMATHSVHTVHRSCLVSYCEVQEAKGFDVKSWYLDFFMCLLARNVGYDSIAAEDKADALAKFTSDSKSENKPERTV